MRIGPQRPVNPEAIVAPHGYRVEALITGLTFPSAVSFGPGGELYLAESGGPCGSLVAVPRVLRVDPDESVTEIGRLEAPIVGLVYRHGELMIGVDGFSPQILRVTAEGEVRVLVEGLPGGGDYGLSGLSLDTSGALLFGLGTRTNSGIVGLDNVARGWVRHFPDWADVPGADVELTGVNYVTQNPWAGPDSRLATGAFQPFGRRCEPRETVRGAQRCGGALYRLPVEGGEPERIAWGLRNPTGVACSPDGRLFAMEGGMEERGSRPVAGAPDCLWEVRTGGYYGWPDHVGGVPVTEPRFRLPGHPQPRRLLNGAPVVSGTPAAVFPARSGIGRGDFSSSPAFGFAGEAFVALSGPWSLPAYPEEADSLPGHRVVRVDPRTGQVADFLVNRHAAPSSEGGSGGLERPFDVQFDPTGEVLYVVDIGEVRLTRERGLEPFGGTGVLWRITRIRPMAIAPALAAAEPAPPEEPEEPGEAEAAAEQEAEEQEAEEQEAAEQPETGEAAPEPEPEAPPEPAGEEPPIEASAPPHEPAAQPLPSAGAPIGEAGEEERATAPAVTEEPPEVPSGEPSGSEAPDREPAAPEE